MEPMYAHRMQAAARAAADRGSIAFHGTLDDEQMSALLTSSDALVLPSEYEAFGIAYLEGMRHGLPAIGTTSGGAAEIITDGLDGFLVTPRNPSDLADRLNRLQDRRRLKEMSMAARGRYLRQPDWAGTSAKVRTFLAAVAGGS
jgi:glycosyltransferase involved in cell wall biosynthesis